MDVALEHRILRHVVRDGLPTHRRLFLALLPVAEGARRGNAYVRIHDGRIVLDTARARQEAERDALSRYPYPLHIGFLGELGAAYATAVALAVAWARRSGGEHGVEDVELIDGRRLDRELVGGAWDRFVAGDEEPPGISPAGRDFIRAFHRLFAATDDRGRGAVFEAFVASPASTPLQTLLLHEALDAVLAGGRERLDERPALRAWRRAIRAIEEDPLRSPGEAAPEGGAPPGARTAAPPCDRRVAAARVALERLIECEGRERARRFEEVLAALEAADAEGR